MAIRISTNLLRPRRDQPAAKLGLGATPLAEFFQALGQGMFGERWEGAPNPPLTKPGRENFSGQVSRTMQVVEQMRLSLDAEEITAALNLYLPPREPSDDDLCAFDDEDQTAHRHYTIAGSAWDCYWPGSVSDWATSEMSVRAMHINVAEGRAHLRENYIIGSLIEIRPDLHYSPEHVLRRPVIILRGEAALRKLLPLTSLPSPAEAQRYSSFRNRLLDEVVASAWRSIALRSPYEMKLQPKSIIEYMNNYLRYQNIDGEVNGLSDKTLEVLARKVFQQWERRDTANCVLLNSSPLKPARPPL